MSSAEKPLAHLRGAPSNDLFAILTDWDHVLQATSIGNGAYPANLSGDEYDALIFGPTKTHGPHRQMYGKRR